MTMAADDEGDHRRRRGGNNNSPSSAISEEDEDRVGPERGRGGIVGGGTPKPKRGGRGRGGEDGRPPRSRSKSSSPLGVMEEREGSASGSGSGSAGGQQLLDAIRSSSNRGGDDPTTAPREKDPTRDIDDMLSSGRDTPATGGRASSPDETAAATAPDSAHRSSLDLERVGDLPPRASSPPLPVLVTPTSGSSPGRSAAGKPAAGLSNYRHLSKAERLRLLNEVKMVLGEESLLSGMDEHGGIVDYSEDEDEDQEDEDRSRDDQSRDEYRSRDPTMDMSVFSEEQRTMYTADTSAFYTEGDNTEATSAFYTEDDASNYRRYNRARSSATTSHSRGDDRTTTDSILSEAEIYLDEEDEEDGNFFSLADACVSYLCDGNRQEAEEMRKAKEFRKRRQRRERDEREWNRRPRVRRGGGRSRDDDDDVDEDENTLDDETFAETATLETAGTREFNKRGCAIPGFTVKERLAELEEELITGRKENGDGEGGVMMTDPTSYDLELEGRQEDPIGFDNSGISPIGFDDRGARDDDSNFWKGDGMWRTDPSTVAGSGSGSATTFNPSPTNDSGNNVTGANNTSGGHLEGCTSSGGDDNGVQITLSHWDRTGSEYADGDDGEGDDGGSAAPSDEGGEAKEPDADDKDGGDGGGRGERWPIGRGGRSASPFVRAKSITKASASEFVRVVSSISQKLSRMEGADAATSEEANDDDADAAPPVGSVKMNRGRTADESLFSIRTEMSNDTKETRDTKDSSDNNPAAMVGSLEDAGGKERSAKTSASARSAKSGKSAGNRSAATSSSITRKKKGWKEYLDPSTGNMYYSNGKITSWVRPANADIVPTSRTNSPTTPRVSNTTPLSAKNGGANPPPMNGATAEAAAASSSSPSSTNDKSKSANNNKGKSSRRKANKFRLFSKLRNRGGNDASPSGGGQRAGKNASSSSRDGPAGGRKKKKKKGVASSGMAMTTPAAAAGACTPKNPASPDRTVDSDRSHSLGTRAHATPLATIITGVDVPVVGNRASDVAVDPATTTATTPKKKKKKKKQKQGGWREYTDKVSGKKYYSDGVTTSWERPGNFTEGGTTPSSSSPVNDADNTNAGAAASSAADPGSKGASNGASDRSRKTGTVKNATTLTASSSAVATTTTTATVKASTAKTTNKGTPRRKGGGGWREYTDPGSGKKYYSDGVTTTWDRPPGYKPRMVEV